MIVLPGLAAATDSKICRGTKQLGSATGVLGCKATRDPVFVHLTSVSVTCVLLLFGVRRFLGLAPEIRQCPRFNDTIACAS